MICEVTTLGSVNVIPGHPFTLSCNVSTETGDRVRQVRWLDPHGQLLMAYEPGDPPFISVIRDEVRLSPHHSHTTSAITMATADPAQQGCYDCVFDVYPSGTKQGQTCLTLTPKVFLEGGGVVESGGVARLQCRYAGDQGSVRQVVWRRRADTGQAGGESTHLASYSRHGQPLVEEALRGRGSLTSSLVESELTLQNLEPQDEGCYTCVLHTFPDGSLSNSTCLAVYVLPEPELFSITRSSGVVEANCTTRSRPASNITWNIARDNQILGPPTVSYEDEEGGTTRVTSTLLVQSELLKHLSVKCFVQHPGLDQPLSLSLSVKASSEHGQRLWFHSKSLQ
ncbi:hypothetical protein CRUP_018939 [Coryphaenoides rupestris]|nr:hypothetical protein CRUP_018939 [Coryphaenoides rupestris]